MGNVLGAIVTWLLGLIFKRRSGPSAEERAGRAEAQLEQEKAKKDAITQAAVVRADADARVVRSLQSDDPRAELRKQFPGASRD